MHSGIWLSDKTYLDFSASEHSGLLAEIAGRMGTLVGQWMGILPDPDPVLRKSGDGIAELEALDADYKVTVSRQTRKLKTLGRDAYGFSPGAAKNEKPTPEAEALCRALNADLERVDLYNVMSEILDAPAFGFTVAELFWKPAGTRMRLTNIVPKPREWFAFDTQNRLRFLGDGFSAGCDVDAAGLLPPPGKFAPARHFPTYANPYGVRLLSRCLFPVAFKRGGIEFMMRFAERWGMPWIVGKTRPGALDPERYAMRDALAGMVRDAVAVINSGADVQLVESKSQTGDLHLSIIRHWDDAIAQVLTGQTLTSTIGEAGSYAASKTHAGILEDYTDADAKLVKTFFDEVAWIYGNINMPGVLTPVFSFDDPEDLKALAELGKSLHSQGARFTPAYFERRFGLAPDEFTVAAGAEGAPAGSEPESGRADGDAFAAPTSKEKQTDQTKDGKTRLFTPGQQAIEDLIAEVLPKGVTAVEDMASVILNLVAKADTPEELQDMLAAQLLPAGKDGLDASAFGDVLECALFAADMAGRFTARENIV